MGLGLWDCFSFDLGIVFWWFSGFRVSGLVRRIMFFKVSLGWVSSGVRGFV